MAEVLALPFVGAVCGPLIGLGIFIFARRRLKQDETLSSRASYFYPMMSGIMGGLFLAQLLSHTYLTAASEVRFFVMFIFVGYFVVMLWGEMVGAVWNYNPNYVAPSTDNMDASNTAYNKETGEQEDIAVVDNLRSPLAAEQLWESQDAGKHFTKRNWMLGTTLSVFCVLCVTDSLLMVLRLDANVTSHAALIICYYINGMSMSVVFFSAVYHARLQAKELHIRIWLLLGLLWCLILTCSSIPALINAPVAFVTAVLNHRAYIAVNGIATGGLLKLHFYFHHMELPSGGWGPSICGALICSVGALQSMLTGVFL